MSATRTADHAPRPAGKPWTFTDAAEFLNISVKHLRHLSDVGKVAAVRIGLRKRLIPDAEVRRIAREGVDDAAR
jgi:excisionase family DNA binding protein